ncbi:hypothetical protein AVEN_200383-1 [Araneus ventricosus]|uniref:Uncharacterized protein n=1 Tax=Araneus ventricosus TaxID=182803 RepID=A0A4Y2WAH4_ARAVE|nr:hypothetical protein AVEN_200383-1 [Araneus ventricosus]
MTPLTSQNTVGITFPADTLNVFVTVGWTWVRTPPYSPVLEAITATVPVGWTWDRTLPYSPVPEAITATVPVGWTWDVHGTSR